MEKPYNKVIIDRECPYCHEHFMTHKNAFTNHVTWCKMNPKYEERRKKRSELNSQQVQSYWNRMHGELKDFIVICDKCGKSFTVTEYENKFPSKKKYYCSIHCAKSRGELSDEVKNKISQKHLKDHPAKERTCKVCQKKYVYRLGNSEGSTKICCCKQCSEYLRNHWKEFLSQETLQKLRETGKKSAYTQKESRRSKNEVLFCSLCEQKFSNVIHNEPIFNGWDADVILQDQKIAVLWNGKWHYEEIISDVSLKQIQNRDQIKIKEIEKAGYTPYIIKDLGKYNEKFVNEQFKIFCNSIK